jgi:hypothetical protein
LGFHCWLPGARSSDCILRTRGFRAARRCK